MSRYKLFLLLVILCIVPEVVKSAQKKDTFEGDEVIRSYPTTDEHIKALAVLQDKGFDFWTDPRKGAPTDIRVTKSNKEELLKSLNDISIKNEVKISDVSGLIKVERKASIKKRKNGVLDWKDYESHASIQQWIKKMATTHKDTCKQIKIGQTFEKRDMLVLWIGAGAGTPAAKKKKPAGRKKRAAPTKKATVAKKAAPPKKAAAAKKGTAAKKPGAAKKNGAPVQKKKALWLDGGIHAREWISPAIVTWIINELLTNKSQYSDILDKLDIYILPQVNPDGYEFTRSKDRMWRKTRSNNKDSNCKGADPNRNFGYMWGGEGASTNPCSTTYRGSKAFSEIETRQMQDFIAKRAEADWRIYVTIHSYSQMILTPWGFKEELPEDYPELERLGKKAADAIKAVNGIEYEVGSATVLLGPGAGGSDDWAKGSGIFKYSYTVEARDTGDHGFVLPKDQIIPTCQEVFEGFLVFARDIAEQP